MNKVRKINQIIVLCILSLFTLFSCEVGLGPAVDMQAPSVELTSHKPNDYVATNFVLKGVVKDNEAISRLTIDFDNADIHYLLDENGVWSKKTSYQEDWVVVEEKTGTVLKSSKLWEWAIPVSANDVKEGTGASLSFTIIAYDKVGNTASASKVDCSVIVDEEIPSVTINRPELDATYEIVKGNFDTYQLEDGNVISRLLNGVISLDGRQDSASSFKELRIEFDDGTTEEIYTSGNSKVSIISTEEISNEYPCNRKNIYYSKTLKIGEDGISDLRTWKLELKPEDWINDEENSSLKTERRVIRVVTTSISSSDAWERKVLGYFIWEPKADKPWITMYSGSETLEKIEDSSLYPASKIYGLSQDDDGIAAITYNFAINVSKDKDKDFETYQDDTKIPLSEENPKSAQWVISVPSEVGYYKLTVKTEDINGKVVEETRYFDLLDIQPPKISVEAPKTGDSALTESGKISFKGKFEDDGTVETYKIVYLNQNNTSPESKLEYLNRKLEYLNSSHEVWNRKPGSYDGDILFDIKDVNKLEENSEKTVYSFSKEFDIFEDLKIGSENQFTTQEFILYVKDNADLATVELVTLNGDTKSPELKIEEIKHRNVSYFFDSVPNLPVLTVGEDVIVTGTWSDDSTTQWDDFTKIGEIKFYWGDEEVPVQKDGGKWSATLTKGSETLKSGVIKVSLKDFGGNEAVVTKTVFVEQAEAELEGITVENADGSYKAGDVITFSLNFSKNVKFGGTKPTLTLSNGEIIVCSAEENDSASKFEFDYEVKKDDKNTNKLLVSSINDAGTTWIDAKTDVSFDIGDREETEETIEGYLMSRNIKIDTEDPYVESITVNNDSGSYKAGSTIYFTLTFSEPVTVKNPKNLKIAFDNDKESGSSANGSTTMLIPYKIEDGHDIDKLSFESLSHEGVIVTDEAGNTIDWKKDIVCNFKEIKIDTIEPYAPSIEKDFEDGQYVTSGSVSFSYTGEEGAEIWYSTNGGNSWKLYEGKQSITNSGNYTILAYQIDKAGNKSDNSAPLKVTIDNKPLITRISATTIDGTYSDGTVIKQVDGYIEFRKEVTIEQGAEVTLNVKRDGKNITAPLSDCESGEKKSKKFKFTYEIKSGDVIDDNAELDVTDFSFKTVKIGNDSVIISVPDEGYSARFSENKDIFIYTTDPVVKSVKIEEDKDAKFKLVVEFDRPIFKSSGEEEIVLTQKEDTFRIPTVLTESEYKKLIIDKGISGIESYYDAGINGATKDDKDNTLELDNSTKYVLKFERNNDDDEVVKLFKDAKLDKVMIPVYSSAVTVSGSVLTVELDGEYKLPTKGAEYTVAIPVGLVKDILDNKNTSNTSDDVSAPGVEKTEIRIAKESYTIQNPGNLYSDVDMPETAQMKISCKTPGAKIYYKINEKKSDPVVVHNTSVFDTKTEDPEAKDPTDIYDEKKEYFLGGDKNTELKFSTATGMKFAISAKATKDGSEDGSESKVVYESKVAYEYAARTVLKFDIKSNYSTDGNFKTVINQGGETVKVEKLTVWVIGGDDESGGNTINTYPLSWTNPSKFKMMKIDESKKNKSGMTGQWYLITWDLSAPTYHGFVAGNVPNDAQVKGPSKWYVGERFYAQAKANYILYPGETLYMAIGTVTVDGKRYSYSNGFNNGDYMFHEKNLVESVR